MLILHLIPTSLLFATTTNAALTPSTPPSPSTLQNALTNAGAGVCNNPLSSSLLTLSQSPNLSLLTQLLTDTLQTALAAAAQLLLDPELHYSYGRSPPVYPSPDTSSDPNPEWSSAIAYAKSLVSQMTLSEKANITLGQSSTQGCSGFSGGVPRLGYEGICLNDAESGVRTGNLVNGYPAQIHMGASWNKALAYQRGLHLGREFKAKGVDVVNGPVIGPIGRMATGGRNWEGFGADHYLAGTMVGPTIEGIQESVVACVKHFVGYEQETNRLPFLAGIIPGLLFQSVSANVDDETMHEVYLWPWYDAVRAGAGAVMASYNRVNNSYATQNSKILNGLLKTELGFQGFVVSDWNGQHTGVASANAGLDMAMPVSEWWGSGQLERSVQNGSVSASRLDDMAIRIISAKKRFSQVTNPGMTYHSDVDARDPASESTLFQSAVEGHVLLKNVNGALPLHKPSALSIFGWDAIGGINTSSASSMAYQFGLLNTPNYTNGLPFGDINIALFFAQTQGYNISGPDVALAGTLLTGGGSGATTPTSSTSPWDALQLQTAQDNTSVYTDFHSLSPQIPFPSSPCLVFINSQSSESWDRPHTLSSSYTDSLVLHVASKCKNTIVVIHNPGIVLVEAWIEHPNVTGVIFAHLPGQESGSALVEVLYGRQSPSGRLPYTVAKRAGDYGPLLMPAGPTLRDPVFPQSDFSEGSFIDYRYFVKGGIRPRFEFGFGLTYSEFGYGELVVERDAEVDASALPPDALGDGSMVAPEGGLESLYDVVATVSATVTNVGNVTAAEVAQLYVGLPNGVERALRGYDKQVLEPGEKAVYEFPLRRRDLSVWDTIQQQWVLKPGKFPVYVGKSVLDIQLTGTLEM